MSLIFNMLSSLVIAFLSRSEYLWISWLHSPSAVILEPRKIKSVTVWYLKSNGFKFPVFFLQAPLGPGPPLTETSGPPVPSDGHSWMSISHALDSYPLTTLTVSTSHTYCLRPWVSYVPGSSPTRPAGLRTECAQLSGLCPWSLPPPQSDDGWQGKVLVCLSTAQWAGWNALRLQRKKGTIREYLTGHIFLFY